MTALHLACKHGNLEACHYIMTQGNGKNFINAQDDGGWTPLVWGCEHQRVDIVKYLHYLPFSGNRKFLSFILYVPGIYFNVKPILVCVMQSRTLLCIGPLTLARLTLLHFFLITDVKWMLPTCTVTPHCKCLLFPVSIRNWIRFVSCTRRHTAGRRDNYECVLLLITRGGRLDLRNKEDQLALEVCPDKNCHSALLLALNMKLQQFTQTPCTDSEKLLSRYKVYED